jgi:long-chain fatty acid transport protein
MKHRTLHRALMLALLGFSATAGAITDEESNASIPFSFSNPGARSLGQGGVFLALADDATAAYTNPAGLVGLGVESQVAFEARHTSYKVPYVNGGLATISSSGGLDLSQVRVGDAKSDVNNLSFLSFVKPFERWAFALYRHELVNYRNRYSVPDGVDYDFGDVTGHIFAFDVTSDFKVVNLGASVGVKVSDTISLGFGVSRYTLDIETATPRADSASFVYSEVDGEIVAFPTVRHTRTSQDMNGSGADDDAYGFNFGMTLALAENLKAGLVYRTGPKFSYVSHFQSTVDVFDPDTGSLLLSVDNPENGTRSTQLQIPDVLGLGFNWRATEYFSIGLDINRINYSNLTSAMQSAFGPSGDPSVQDMWIDDKTEYRLGVEFEVPNRPVFLRAGAWREEGHMLDGSRLPVDDVNRILFSTSRDVNHVSLGAGYAGSRFQVDGAVDHSKNGNIVSVSGVFKF